MARGKRVACLTAAAAIVALAATVVALRGRIFEAWHRHKLETGYAEEQLEAADRLMEMGAVSAIPKILEVMQARCVEGHSLPASALKNGFLVALAKVGKNGAREALLTFNEARKAENNDLMFVAAQAIWQIYVGYPGVTETRFEYAIFFSALRDDERETEEVRRLAGEILNRSSQLPPDPEDDAMEP
jgi:hypothetical protein